MKLSTLVLALAISFTLAQDLVGGYTDIDLTQINNDANLQAVLNYGVSFVTTTAIAAGELIAGNYQVSKINSIREQVVAGANYDFDVELLSDAGDSATATFIVFDQPWTNTREVSSYSVNQIIGGTDSEYLWNDEEGVISEDVWSNDEGIWGENDGEWSNDEWVVVNESGDVINGEFDNQEDGNILVKQEPSGMIIGGDDDDDLICVGDSCGGDDAGDDDLMCVGAFCAV